jgi:ubiquinone/menaquinone biosynthesis C-methylase UbiE
MMRAVVGTMLVAMTVGISAMKVMTRLDTSFDFDKVAAAYSGPEQRVWELTMGKQIDIGAASSTMELAQKAGLGPGMSGVELNCNNGGGMRTLVRLCGVDSMTGVDLTKAVVETGRERTAEEGLSDKITFINANSLENGLPDDSADFVYSKDAWCYMPDKSLIIAEAARIVKPGGKICFTDWIEGEGLSDEEAQRFLGLMTFPAIPTVSEYAKMLTQAGCTVALAENSGRFSPAMDCYLYMLKYQAVYDAKKLLSWDEEAYAKLIADFEFMAELAKEDKIMQGMFIATKPS